MLALTLPFIWAGTPDVLIRSELGCPSATEIAAQMAPLLSHGVSVDGGPGDAAWRGVDRADLSVENGRRWLRLRGSDGRLIQERALPDSLKCAESAKATAVLLATWEFQGRVDRLPPPAPSVSPPPQAAPLLTPPAPAVTKVAVVAPDAALSSRPRTEPPAPPPAPAPGPPTQTQVTSSPQLPRRLSVGAGVSVVSATGQLPISALVEVALGRPEGLGLRLLGAMLSQQSLDLGPGRARWQRSSVGVSGVLTGRHGPWGGQAHVDLVGALLSFSGDGFSVNQDGTQLAMGATFGARAIRTLGAADLWLDAGLTLWPGPHRVFLVHDPASRDLPAYEVGLGLGIDYFVWP
jgi:hypothetical protein